MSGDLLPYIELANQAEGPWVVCTKVPELEMDWFVPADEEEGQEQIGPLHPIALTTLLEDETIAPDVEITQVSTGESYQAVDVLCAILLEQRSELEEQLAEANAAASVEAPAADAAASSDLEAELIALKQENEALKEQLQSAEADADDLPADLPDKKLWREIMRAKDQLGKEAEKWKKFYDDEAVRSARKEESLNEQLSKVNDQEQETAYRLVQAEKKRKVLEEKNFELQEAIARGTSASGDTEVDPLELLNLRRSYNELHEKFELVLDQLKDRTDQLENVYAQRDAIEVEARDKQDHWQEQIMREREDAQKTRRQLIDLESAHRDLLLSYRALNDKIVRDRNNPAGLRTNTPARDEGKPTKRKERRKEKPRGKKVKQAAEAPATEEQTAPAPAANKKKPRGGSGKSRLKLT